MDRLTFETNEEGVFVKKSDVGIWLVKDGIPYTNVIRKLAEYEDLEEQQKLLRLPCAVGDIVWYWDKDRHPLEEAPFEGYISEYEITSNNSVCIIITPKRDFASECFYSSRDKLFIEYVGKTNYYTKEEAKDALKKLNL